MAETGNVGKSKFGLFVPGKLSSTNKPTTLVQKPSIFAEDSDDETTNFKENSGTSAFQARVKKQTQIEIDKALAEDPTVYDYDAIYDTLVAQKEERNPKNIKSKDKKPKYIAGLLKAAEKRKKEYERRVERLVQKEREAEGDEFGDKEAFVTAAYQKKMQEIQEAEEEEKRTDAIEEMLDVTKQKDMGGFYRNLFKQTTGEDTIVKENNLTDDSKEEKRGKKSRSNYRKRQLSTCSGGSEVDQLSKDKIAAPLSSSSDDDGITGENKTENSGSRRKENKGEHFRSAGLRSGSPSMKYRHRHREMSRSPDRRRSRSPRRRRSRSPRRGGNTATRASDRQRDPKQSTSESVKSDQADVDSTKGEVSGVKYARHNTGTMVNEAKQRYLDRKRAKQQAS